MRDDDQTRPYQVERDRFGVMYSGSLEVGEMIEVVPVAEVDRLFKAVTDAYEALSRIEDLGPDSSDEAVEIARAALADGIVRHHRSRLGFNVGSEDA